MTDTTDIWDIKERIKEILIANTTVNVDFHDGTTIHLGIPDNAQFKGLSYPVIFITNDRELMRIRPFAPVISNAQTNNDHTISFRLIIMAFSKDSKTVEKDLDKLQKDVMDALRDNFDLRDPTSGTDSLVTESQFVKIDNFTIGNLEGKPLDGRILKFMVREIS